MLQDIIFCPRCDSNQVVKNGLTHNGNQNNKCKNCNRQFVRNPRKKVIGEETKNLIDKLLLEKLPKAGNCQNYWCVRRDGYKPMLISCTHLFPKKLKMAQKKGRLTIQCDEMWSFVGNKRNKQWIWLALDIETKEIVGVYVGNRSRDGASGLWNSIPALYRQCAVCYTDFWTARMRYFSRM